MITADALPGIKRFFRRAALGPAALVLLIRSVAAVIRHDGRMSAPAAAGPARSLARHRAALARFLADSGRPKDRAALAEVAGLLPSPETGRRGRRASPLDRTYCGRQGAKAENTFPRGDCRNRPKKGNRENKTPARRSCRGFVVGLPLTPPGPRVPRCRFHHTQDYCRAKNKGYRTHTRLAAQLVGEPAAPQAARVVVPGDTAPDAKDVRAAGRRRGFRRVVPTNPERVLAGAKPRPKGSSLVKDFCADEFAPVRLVPGRGPFAARRRAARCRLGPKVKGRTYHAHRERRAVNAVGEVRLAFSAREKPEPGEPVKVRKVLMTAAAPPGAARAAELYDLRWQIEPPFKGLKSTPGFARGRFAAFAKVEGRVQSCPATFVGLGRHRARQLRRRGLSRKGRRRWQWQRSHGLCRALRQEAEDHDLGQLLQWSRTRTGLKKLKKCLRAARPLEDRMPLRN